MDQDTIDSIKKKLRLATKYLDEVRLELKQLEGPGAKPDSSSSKNSSAFGGGNRTEEWFDIDDTTCSGETDKALHVLLNDGRQEWFPKSQVSPDSEVLSEGDSGTLVVSEWIAKTKELV